MGSHEFWARMVALAAGARASSGAPGPATLLRGRRAADGPDGRGPWLGIFHLDGLSPAEVALTGDWLASFAAPLLALRGLLLARPVASTFDLSVEMLTPEELWPEGWAHSPHPVLVFVPERSFESGLRERRHAYAGLFGKARYLPAAADLWAERTFDDEIVTGVARLADPRRREAFLEALDKTFHRRFEKLLPAVEALVLEDLVGARDDLRRRRTLLALACGERPAPALSALAAAELCEARKGTQLQLGPRRYSFAEEPALGYHPPSGPVPESLFEAAHARGLELFEDEVAEVRDGLAWLSDQGIDVRL